MEMNEEIGLIPEADNLINLVSGDMSNIIRSSLTHAPNFGLHQILLFLDEPLHYQYMMRKLSEHLILALTTMSRERVDADRPDLAQFLRRISELSENQITERMVIDCIHFLNEN